jgi:hypothetical protein
VYRHEPPKPAELEREGFERDAGLATDPVLEPLACLGKRGFLVLAPGMARSPQRAQEGERLDRVARIDQATLGLGEIREAPTRDRARVSLEPLHVSCCEAHQQSP